MSDEWGQAYARGAAFKRPGGWERQSAAQRWKRILAISVAGAAVAAIPVIVLYQLYQPRQVLITLLWVLVCAPLMGGLIGASLIRFGRRMYLRPFPWNWTLLVITILAGTAAGSLIANLIFLAVNILPGPDFWSSFWLVNQFAVVIAVIFGLSSFAHEVLRTTMEAAMLELRNRQLEEERARKRALEAQLASLESHIRPHFLFNTLNTISSLIPDDPKLAESLVGKLASLLRFSLDTNPSGVVRLASELKIVRDYLEIENARFGDRLQYRIAIPPELEAAEVPVFCLQTLVENTVKHVVAAREQGAAIGIAGGNGNGTLWLEVSDDGPGFDGSAVHPGHGIDNLKSRLENLYGASAKLVIAGADGRTVVRLQIPRPEGATGSASLQPPLERR